jgi:hypothetical protein
VLLLLLLLLLLLPLLLLLLLLLVVVPMLASDAINQYVSASVTGEDLKKSNNQWLVRAYVGACLCL